GWRQPSGHLRPSSTEGAKRPGRHKRTHADDGSLRDVARGPVLRHRVDLLRQLALHQPPDDAREYRAAQAAGPDPVQHPVAVLWQLDRPGSREDYSRENEKKNHKTLWHCAPPPERNCVTKLLNIPLSS